MNPSPRLRRTARRRSPDKLRCARTLVVTPKKPHVRALVTRYHPSLYSFASRLVDDPREALFLTDDAFDSTLKQLPKCRDENVFTSMLIASLIRAVNGSEPRTARGYQDP